MIDRSAAEIAEQVRSGEVAAVDVVSAHLERIRAFEPQLNSFITVAEDAALEQAARVDELVALGKDPGPLAGVPFSVKDTYDTAGMRTTYGSTIFDDNVPSESYAPVERLINAGGVLVGKTNTPEFAVFIRTVNKLMGECRNAWDRRRIAGGSSGGAAASVAMGLTPIALGSDGGGSVRIPAALNGVFGLMPSRGRLPRSRHGISTRNFSAAGPITRFPRDLQLMLDVMTQANADDPLSRGICPPVLPTRRGHVRGIRWIERNGMVKCDARVSRIVKTAAANLADELSVDLIDDGSSLPSKEYTDLFYAMMKADRLASGGGELLDSPFSDQLTDYARHHLRGAREVSGAEYSRGLEAQFHATDAIFSLLEEDLIVATPTVQITAPLIPRGVQPLPEDARASFVANTFLMNFTGFPAVTIPCGHIDGLPVGLQLVSVPFDEERLIELAEHVCLKAPSPSMIKGEMP
ncbi:amidase [Brevibacterium oceani]|uniref:amidase n=1 Tax=Brevibacterium oceani TaxID=358099 RepID=UPI0015E753F3|nr:amidase [Brevibacterium oceani]